MHAEAVVVADAESAGWAREHELQISLMSHCSALQNQDKLIHNCISSVRLHRLDLCSVIPSSELEIIETAWETNRIWVKKNHVAYGIVSHPKIAVNGDISNEKSLSSNPLIARRQISIET